jgi:hypothetical protein
MDGGTDWAIIVALATALSGITTAVIRYLVGEIRDLKVALAEGNKAVAAANEVNARLAKLWIDERSKRPPRTGSS